MKTAFTFMLLGVAPAIFAGNYQSNGYQQPSYNQGSYQGSYDANSQPYSQGSYSSSNQPGYQESSGYPQGNYNSNNQPAGYQGSYNSGYSQQYPQQQTSSHDSNRGYVVSVRQVESQPSANQMQQGIQVQTSESPRNGTSAEPAITYEKNWTEKDLKDSEEKYPQDAAANDADRQLNAKIRQKLKGWFTNSFDAVVIRTSNGVVVLSGLVKDTDDSKKVEEKVKSIEGVRAVNNQTSVKNK